VLLTHRPSGLQVRCETSRSQLQNRLAALGLLRARLWALEAARVPEVVPHSLRGLHATLASGFGATSHAVAAALGHTSFAVTERHYVDRATLAQARSRRSRAVLSGGSQSGNCPPKVVTGGQNAA
jgi:integrase